MLANKNTPKSHSLGERKIERWKFVKRFGAMQNEFSSWSPALKELSQFCNPTRGFFDTTQANQGKKIDHRIVLDGHARRCIRTLASGMTSGLTSPARPWFRLAMADPGLNLIPQVKEWCDQVQGILLDIFAKSNIYGVLHSMYEEIATFGTAVAFLEEDFKDVVRGRNYTAGEYYLGCGPDGRVNAFARPFWMTTLQLVQEFGIENVTPGTKQAYQANDTQTWKRVNHLIEENDDRIPGIKDFRNMPYRCIYWEEGSDENEYLRLGGYEEFPILAPRWDTTTTADTYGRGPGWDSLGDVKMLQKEQKQRLTALDKVIDPPIQTDASVAEGMTNTLPGGVTRSSSMVPNSGVRAAYQIQPDFNAIRESILEVKKAISESFYSDLFLMFTNQQGNKTATEIVEKQSEKLQILGPVLERLENELLSMLIGRSFAIANRALLIPIPPREIQGVDVKVEYISVLAQAQKMVGVTAVDQWLMGVGSSAQMNPEAVDIIDFDKLNAEKADMLGIPAKIVHTPEEIAEIRGARAEAQAKAQNLQAAEIAAKTARSATGAVKDLATAPTGQGGSALDAITGAMQ